MMKATLTLICVLACGFVLQACAKPAAKEFLRLPMSEYVDKMKAGWIGQMVGVGWGAPTEFKWQGVIIPADKVPKWKPEMVNQFWQDDIYVEMTFMQTLEDYGFDVSIRQAGIDFANSDYRLWHANIAARNNLREGIAPPDSSHPQFSRCADDIDYQIEADFSGLIAPGMPQITLELGEKFGRLMNYGDGLYAGQFVGAMYAAAFFETDIINIIESALANIPSESQYAEMVRDMLAWYRDEPDDWQKVWHHVEAKYHQNADYTHGKCSAPGGVNKFSIDAKLNGSYILMGLLYGQGNLDDTMVIAMRCAQDSDCNPSNAGGILFTTIGFDKLPDRFVSKLDPKGKFSYTRYDFPGLVEVSKKLVRQAVVRAGGSIERNSSGEEVLVIPVKPAVPSALIQVKQPGPIANSRFTEEERAQITRAPKGDISAAVKKFAPGWTVANCGAHVDNLGLQATWGGRKQVLVTHPKSRTIPCVLSKVVDVPAGKKTTLILGVAHDSRGDWVLIVKADGQQMARKDIGKSTSRNGWMTVTVDLSGHAGKSVNLDLENHANGWSWETGYWSEITIEHK